MANAAQVLPKTPKNSHLSVVPSTEDGGQAQVNMSLGHPNPGSNDVSVHQQVDERCRELNYLLGRVAARFARRLPSHVELDDLVGAGGIGLVTAVQQHLDKPLADLKRLAEQRIRGAILDYLRSVDHLTRRQRAAVSALNRAKVRLASEGGDATDIQTVAADLGITVERARHIESHLAVVQLTSLEDSDSLKHAGMDPSQLLVDQETKERLSRALTELPERLQTLLSLYYQENLTYKEIGEVLGISRSRICQLHTQAVGELRRLMTDVLDEVA